MSKQSLYCGENKTSKLADVHLYLPKPPPCQGQAKSKNPLDSRFILLQIGINTHAVISQSAGGVNPAQLQIEVVQL